MLVVTVLWVLSIVVSIVWVLWITVAGMNEAKAKDPMTEPLTGGAIIGSALSLACFAAFFTLLYGCAMAVLLAIRSMSKRD